MRLVSVSSLVVENIEIYMYILIYFDEEFDDNTQRYVVSQHGWANAPRSHGNKAECVRVWAGP